MNVREGKMKQLGTKKPLLFSIILIIIAFFISALLTVLFSGMNFETKLATALARIITAAILFIVFFPCFKDNRPFKGVLITLPCLIVVVWNLFYNMNSGFASDNTISIIISALAPALFEEILFRGIIIRKFLDSGKDKNYTWIISSVLFGAIHLTNIVGMSLINVVVQTLYAFVIGLMFGSIYLRSNDIVSLIIAHFLIDLSSQLFKGPETTSLPMLIAFVVLLVLMVVYAWYLRKTDRQDQNKQGI